MILSINILHKKNLAHRDFKPPNLLFSEETKAFKISDFGFS